MVTAALLLLFLSGFLHQPASTYPIEEMDLIGDNPNCKLLLNELNTDQPGEKTTQQFLELKLFCVTKPGKRPSKLKGYKIIFVRGYTPSVTLFLDLKDKSVRERVGDRYFVIGRALVPLVDLDLKDNLIQNTNTDKALPLGDDSPYGIILLYSDSLRAFDSLKLRKNERGEYIPTALGKEEISLIKNHGKDSIVYGRKTQTNRCTVFESVWPDSSILNPSKLYLLRDMDSDHSNKKDLSLNRCTSSVDGFKPESFKFGKPTPGDDNDCSASMFFLEDIIDEVAPLASQADVQVLVSSECQPDRENIPAERYASVSNAQYVEMVHDQVDMVEASCLRNVEGGLQIGEMQMELENNNRLIERTGNAAIVPTYEANVFDQQWIEQCKHTLPREGEILKNLDVQKWLNIRVQTSEGKHSCSFRCSFCVNYLKRGFRPDKKHIKSIETEEGISSRFPHVNEKAIREHPKDSIHFSAMHLEHEISLINTKEELERVLKLKNEEENRIYLPTLRVLVAVYAEVITGGSFRSHKVIMDLGKYWEVELGFHHHNFAGARKMLVTMSESFHTSLLNSLVEQNKPFSLLVDTSTDNTNIAYMITYIQTLEFGQPIIYLYRLIELTHGEKAIDMMKSLKEVIEIDTKQVNNKFENYFKTKMVSYSSDGASVMIGPGESLQTHVQNFIGRKVTGIHSMAHKIQLSLLRALYKSKNQKFDYFKDFEKTINSFYNFYSSRGSKRWLHLSDIAQELGLSLNRIKYFFEVRWAASQYSALQNIFKDYEALRVDLTAIVMDTTFTLAARNTAEELHNKLSDKTYVAVLLEILDLLNIYKMISKTLQGEAGLLAGKGYIVSEGIKEFEKLKSNYGPELKGFLNLCECPTVCAQGHCTIEEYDDCPNIVYKQSIHLGNTDGANKDFKLSVIRKELYEEIIVQIKEYFNMELLDAFDIFNNRRFKLPQCPAPPPEFPDSNWDWKNFFTAFDMHIPDGSINVTKIVDDDQSSMAKVCDFYLMSPVECHQVTQEWGAVKASILVSELYLLHVKSDLGIFWPTSLKNSDFSIPWTDLTTQLIENVLSTPFGTSDCERGFSVVSKTKSDESNRLTPTTLEHLVRVKVNGPQSLIKLNAEKYTREFLKKYIRVDDEQFRGGRLPKAKDEKKYFPNSVLF